MLQTSENVVVRTVMLMPLIVLLLFLLLGLIIADKRSSSKFVD